MKKIIFLLLTIISFSVYSQEPTHTKKPKTFQPGNWYMVGNWDSISASYKDTIGYYLEKDTIYHWANRQFNMQGATTVNNVFKAGLSTKKGWLVGIGVDTVGYSGDMYPSFSTSKGTIAATNYYSSGINIKATYANNYSSAFIISNKYNSSLTELYSSIVRVDTSGIILIRRTQTVNNSLTISDTGLSISTNGIERISIDTNGASTLTGDLTVTGQLKYHFIHGQASTDSISFTTGSTQSVYYKLNPTGGDTLKSHEEDGVTFPGDSAKITVAGHYSVKCYLNISTSGANDKIRVKLFKNNAPFPLNSIGTWIINSDGTGANSETKSFEWYVSLAANDCLSVRVANLTGARACVLRDMKLIIEKKPE